MHQEVQKGDKALKNILKGIKMVSDSVGMTIGPRGKNVIVSGEAGSPMVTNDGVTIARNFAMAEDEWVNTGVQLVKQVSERSNVVGDGTTTSTVLASHMAEEALRHLTVGASSVEMKEDIQKAHDRAQEKLKKIAKTIKTKEELIQVATVSVEDKEMGRIIGELMHEVGEDGAITVETSRDVKLEKIKTDGLKFDQGFANFWYLQTPLERARQEVDAKDVGVLVTNCKLEYQDQIMPITEKLTAQGIKELVIICDDITEEALQMTVDNTQRKTFKYTVVRLPGLDDHRTYNGIDIATALGAKFIDRNIDTMEQVELEDLGSAKRLVVRPYETIIINGSGKKKDVDNRIQELKREKEISIYPEDRDRLKERIARLSGSIGIIKVGTPIESELVYKQHKLEDGLAATRAAWEEGVVAGGGIALFELYEEGKTAGEKIFNEALLAPLKKIAENAGKNPETIIEKLREREAGIGWDAKKDEFVDMIKNGIIDPVKVTRAAIQNSTSMAIMYLGVGSHIVNIKDEEDKKEGK